MQTAFIQRMPNGFGHSFLFSPWDHNRSFYILKTCRKTFAYTIQLI